METLCEAFLGEGLVRLHGGNWVKFAARTKDDGSLRLIHRRRIRQQNPWPAHSQKGPWISLLDCDQVRDLCELIHTSCSGDLPVDGSRTLGLFRCVQIILLMLWHNLTQGLLADIHMVSQATISRVVTVYTALIAELLQAWMPEVGDLDPEPSAQHH